MTDETDVVNVTETEQTPEATGKKRAPKERPVKEKPPAPKYWITAVGNKPSSIYGQIQAVVFAHPGLTEAELFPFMKETLTPPKRGVDEEYVGGYLTGGLRRGYLTNNEAEASAEFGIKAEPVREPKEPKSSAPSGAGDAIIKALEKILADNGVTDRTNPISGASLSEATGKSLPSLARTLKKLEKEGHLVIALAEDGKTIQSVALTEKPAPAAEPDAPIA